METENENFWNESKISKNKTNFFDFDAGSCLSKEKRVFESESETLENYVEKSTIKNAGNPSKNFQMLSIDTSTTLESFSSLDLNIDKNPASVLSKHEAEINFYKRKLTEIVDPSTTVLRIVMGQPYSVDCYKSKEHKLALLDEALKIHDGNAILIAVLFMERTLKASIFNMEMALRPVALDHYINYLCKERILDAKAIDTLSNFNRSNQAAMLKFKQAASCTDPISKISSLKRCLASHFSNDPTLQYESSLLKAYINLLELQVPIHENDKRVSSTNEVLQRFPPPTPLPNNSALSTLYYCCFYHYHDNPTLLSSPQMIMKNQELSEKQYIWKAMGALIRLSMWKEFDDLFITKNWMGGKRLKSPVDFDRIVCYLHCIKAPLELKEKYCELIDDVDKRIQTATFTGCHKVVLKTYKEMRDRRSIEEYQLLLSPNSPEGHLATEFLNDSSIKWRK